jgi:hypothetical protein
MDVKKHSELLKKIEECNRILRTTKSNEKYQQAKYQREKLKKQINDLHK